MGTFNQQNKLIRANKNAPVPQQLNDVIRNQESIWARLTRVSEILDRTVQQIKTRKDIEIDSDLIREDSEIFSLMSGDSI